jgi:hypothetical protein
MLGKFDWRVRAPWAESKVRRKADLEVSGDFDSLMVASQKALEAAGARLIGSERVGSNLAEADKVGRITARKLRMGVFPYRIWVEVRQAGPHTVSKVLVKSDAYLPTIFSGYYGNERNVR